MQPPWPATWRNPKPPQHYLNLITLYRIVLWFISSNGAEKGIICLLFIKPLFKSAKHTNLDTALIILIPTAWYVIMGRYCLLSGKVLNWSLIWVYLIAKYKDFLKSSKLRLNSIKCLVLKIFLILASLLTSIRK